MSTDPAQVKEKYRQLVSEINQDVDRIRQEYGKYPCPTDCFQCCNNTSTIPISEVEARDLQIGLNALPRQIRLHIYNKALKTIKVLESKGFTSDSMVKDSGLEAIDIIKGQSYGQCPMLIGGVCSVYEHRPVICRVWGYPIDNGNELACCRKTFIGQRRNFNPVKYSLYWQKCKTLSEDLGVFKKTPACYTVLKLIDTK
ncbi:hypothetical protein JT359_11170 [Candidatus Poribacteria bacterium]|nr:hypothetical protein [Candidatus Poribacteria bacterium]